MKKYLVLMTALLASPVGAQTLAENAVACAENLPATYTFIDQAGEAFPNQLVEVDVTANVCGEMITPPLRGMPETAKSKVFRLEDQISHEGFRLDIFTESEVILRPKIR